MTAKNRAKILIKEFNKAVTDAETVRQCALICANQLIRNYEKHPLARVGQYWQEVKEEVDNLETPTILKYMGIHFCNEEFTEEQKRKIEKGSYKPKWENKQELEKL